MTFQNTSDHRKQLIQKAYKNAGRELRNLHQEEFHALLEQQYEVAGLVVRKRFTGQRKRQNDIEKLRAQLGALESNN